MQGITTIAALVNLLSLGLTGLLTGAKLRITAVPFVPGPTTVPADVTIPTMTGYTDKTVAWNTAGYDSSLGEAVSVGTATYEFVGPGDNTGQVMVGWALLDSTLATVIASGLFPDTVSLLLPTDVLTLAVRVQGSGLVTLTSLS